MTAGYVIRTADGQPLGRMTVSGPLTPVDPPFAYVYDTRQTAEAAASTYAEATTVEAHR